MRGDGRALRVAMVVASPFPANHGTPGSIREMAEAISERGHQVHLVTYHFGEKIPVRNVQIHRIPDIGFRRRVRVGPTYDKPVLDLLMVFKLIGVIRREGIDLIHAHNYEGALVGYLAKMATRKPMLYNAVCTMTDELPSYRFIRPPWLAAWLARVLDHWVPRTADQVVPLSIELARFLQDKGIPADRIHTIPLGVDTSRFRGADPAPVRAAYRIGKRPLVLYTGTLDRFQRIDYLLRAMKKVVGKIGEARLLMVVNVANEEDLQACRTMVDDLGIKEHVEIVAHQSFDEIPHFLAAADVTVVPRPECPGFPVKLLNYMAAARPIVVFEGSAKGLQHLKQAVVVPNHGWEALGDGIVTLLQNPVLADMLGRNVREWVEQNLAWPKIVGQIEEVYYRCLGEAGGGEEGKLDDRRNGSSLFRNASPLDPGRAPGSERGERGERRGRRAWRHDPPGG
jgi:glycosyltransferase involved in cell wall biosynthesis